MRQGTRLFLAVSGGAFTYILIHEPLAMNLSSPLLAGVLVGLVAVLAAPCDLAVVGALLAVILGEVVDVSVGLESAWHAEHLLLASSVAGMTAWGMLRALAHGPAKRRDWFAGVALVVILLGMVGSTINNSQNPIWKDQSLYEMLQVAPQPYQYSSDEAIYMRTYVLMHDEGMGYYAAARTARLQSKNAIGQAIPGGAISYRLPTGYLLWAAFPGPSGLTVLPLIMIMGTFAVLASFVIAQRLVGNAAGIVAAAGTALFYAEIASNQAILHVEPWAASAALGAICTMVLWRTSLPRDDRWLWASAALALAAASIRELDVVLIVAGLLACLLVEKGLRRKAMVPWLCALGGFTVLYAAHVALVSEGLLANRASTYWLQPDVSRAVPVLSHGLETMSGAPVVPVLLAAIGLFAVMGLRDRVLRMMLAMGVVFPTALFMVFGPAGTATVVSAGGIVTTGAEPPGYWGGLISPIVVVCATLAVPVLVRLVPARAVAAARNTRRKRDVESSAPA